MQLRLHTFRRTLAMALPLLACLLLAACGDGRPADVLSEREMVPVLKDLHIGYAGVDLTVGERERATRYQEVSKTVLDKYNLDKATFDRSMEYYQQRPVLMDTIYVQVIDALNMEGAARNPQAQPGSPAKPPGGILKVKTDIDPNQPH